MSYLVWYFAVWLRGSGARFARGGYDVILRIMYSASHSFSVSRVSI
jgi:hypothetical protein